MLTAAAGLAWVAALNRLWVTLRNPPTLWRWSFTLAVLCVAAGATIHAHPAVIDQTFGPATANLSKHLLIIVAAAGVLLYLATLTYARPPRPLVTVIVGAASALAVFQVVTWTRAPIHDRHWSDLADAPGVATYTLSFHLAIVLTNSCAAWFCIRSIGRHDPSRALGLALVAAGSSLTVIALGSFALRTVLDTAFDRDVTSLRRFAEALGPICVMAIAAGTLVFLLGPQAHRAIASRRLTRDLAPLWEAVSAASPDVGLVRDDLDPGHELDRRVIEIQDALSRLPVQPHPDAYRAVAHALLSPPLAGPYTADEVLPHPQTPEDERAILTRLATTLKEVRDAPPARRTPT